MMVLIMANINYLVILICSNVFLLSSFVSSQQKLRNLEDPTEFYNHALYLRTHYPEYYAKNFKGITDHYNKLISATEAKRVSLNRRTSNNNGQRNGVTNSAGPITPVQDNRSSKLARRIPQDNNVSPSRPKSTEKAGRAHSRSLTSTESSELKAFKNMLRSNSSADTDRMEPELAWAHTCFTLGYNNTNGSCQSEPEEIELAPNQTICRSYFKFGCQYQLNQELCVAAVDKVMKNTSFNCDFNINGDSEWMSVQCCMACKSGINTAISKDSCDMHSDNSMPSFAQEKCCNIFLNQNISVSTTESIPVSFKPGSMNAIMSDLDDQVSNSTTFKLSNSLDSTTESIKPGSLNEVVVHLDDRFSNNETNKPEIDSSTVPETSTLPTTTTTIATPSTSTESTTAPSTTTTAATTTTTTTELTTTTSTTTTKSPITSETTTLQPTTSDPTSLLALRSFEEDPNPERIPDGYRLRDAKKNLYEKMDEEDRSKADFLVILKKELEMDSDARYKDFTLMNITLRRNIRCNWEFKIEKVDPEDGVKTLTEKDFKPKPEKHRFILLIDSEEVQPQTIQYSVSCNIKQYKYYKYIVNLTIINK